MDYVNIDIRVTSEYQKENSEYQKENSYLVTASTTGRNKKIVPGRFSFSVETWQSVEPSLIALGSLGVRDARTHGHAQKVRDFGKYLFNCLINGEVRSLYDNKREDAANNSRILRLRLILVPLDLVVLPWEILFDERHSEYLCLTQQPKTILIRSIDGVTHKKDNSSKYAPPLRMLGVIADPGDLPLLQSKQEKNDITDSLQWLVQDKKFVLEWKSATISEFDDLPYSTDRWDIFHFTGHGRFDETSRQGQLAFEDERRRSKFISTQRFYASLPPATKLVVLNACETARGNRFDRLSNIAHSLATQKIPAVVAMQFQILDTASNRFSKIFYTLLARGTAVDEAVAEARREIHKTAEDPDRLDWAAPILYVSSSNIISFKTDLKPERKRIPPPPPEKSPEPEQDEVVHPSTPASNASSPAITLPLDPDETTSTLPPEQEAGANTSVPVPTGEPPVNPPSSFNIGKTTVVLPPELGEAEDPPITSGPNEREKNVLPTDGETSPGGLTTQPPTPFHLPPSIHGIPRRVYIPLASIIIVMLVLGGVFVLPYIGPRPSPTTTTLPHFRPTPSPLACESGNITIDGSSAFQPLLSLVANDYTQKCQTQGVNAHIDVKGSKSGEGVQKVEDGQINIGSSDLLAEKILAPSLIKDLVDYQVAAVIFTVIINDQVKITNLTINNLKNIYTSNSTNWQSVGGPDLGITAYTRSAESGTRITFDRYVLDDLSESIKESPIETTQQMVTAVETKPGAIGYASLYDIETGNQTHVKKIKIDGIESSIDGVKRGIYPFWNIEHLYTKGRASGLTKALIDYMGSNSSTAIMESHSFVSINNLSSNLLDNRSK